MIVASGEKLLCIGEISQSRNIRAELHIILMRNLKLHFL